MTLSRPRLPLILVLTVVSGHLIHSKATTQCRQLFSAGSYRDDSLADCQGDFCFVHFDRKQNLTIGGCITGVPNVEPRCYKAEDETICFCGEGRHCNARSDYQFKSADDNFTRFFCDMFDSRPLPSDRRPPKCSTGGACYYRKEKFLSQPGTVTEIETSGCQARDYVERMAYRLLVSQVGRTLLTPNVCLGTQNDAVGGVSDCVCRGADGCNAPSVRPPVVGTFADCHMTPSVDNDTEHADATCRGHYCYVLRSTMTMGVRRPALTMTGSPVQKGCLNVTDEPVAAVGYRRFDLATHTEEVWLCDEPLCNSDLEAAELSIRSSHVSPSSTTISDRTVASTSARPPSSNRSTPSVAVSTLSTSAASTAGTVTLRGHEATTVSSAVTTTPGQQRNRTTDTGSRGSPCPALETMMLVLVLCTLCC